RSPGVRRPDVDPRRGNRQTALVYFRTAVRLARAGRTDDALLMYVLAFDESAGSPDAAIFRNLGLLHNELGNAAKARACLRGYLERAPDGADADRIRTLVSSFSGTKSVPCVDAGELVRGRKTAARSGSMIRAWVDETLAERLR
ncbi:hypothetical protein L6R52_43870, partial [Myxococcota bacterium]|nr:hypothetical protein [Myxococcota bacterium]